MAVDGGFGLVFKVDVAATPTTVPNVKDSSFPETEHVLDDITAHDSTGGYEEFIATGLIRTGEFEVDVVWDIAEATHAELQSIWAAGTSTPMSLATPASAETLSFSGLVKTIQRASPIDKALTSKVKIKVNGAITFT